MYINSFANDQHQPEGQLPGVSCPFTKKKRDRAYLNVLIVGKEMDLLLSNQYYFDQESVKLTRLPLLK